MKQRGKHSYLVSSGHGIRLFFFLLCGRPSTPSHDGCSWFSSIAKHEPFLINYRPPLINHEHHETFWTLINYSLPWLIITRFNYHDHHVTLINYSHSQPSEPSLIGQNFRRCWCPCCVGSPHTAVAPLRPWAPSKRVPSTWPAEFCVQQPGRNGAVEGSVGCSPSEMDAFSMDFPSFFDREGLHHF